MSLHQEEGLGRESDRDGSGIKLANPFFYEDGTPVDAAVSLFMFYLRIFRLIVFAVLFVFGPILVLWNIPSYLALWREQPGFTNFCTQLMLCFSTPMLCGLVRYYFKRPKSPVGKTISLLLAVGLTLVTLGFIVWDVQKLPEFLTLVRKKPEAWILSGIVATFFIIGLVFGMSVGKETPD